MLRRILHSVFYIPYSRGGQSLVELLIAVAIGTILVAAAAAVISPVLKINTQANRAQTATALAHELLDNVRVWAEGDWHNISGLATTSANHYYLNTATSPFSSSTGDEPVTVSTTTYTRYFYVDDVFRDASGNITNSSSGASFDPSTKLVTVVAYSWPTSATYTISTYLTRYRNNVFDQTDWSGGPGQGGPTTSTNSMFSTSSNIDYTTTTGSIYIKFP
jgi:type II secretory pathway pseudopilin PulG